MRYIEWLYTYKFSSLEFMMAFSHIYKTRECELIWWSILIRTVGKKRKENKVTIFLLKHLIGQFIYSLIFILSSDGYVHSWSTTYDLFRTLSSMWRKCEWMALWFDNMVSLFLVDYLYILNLFFLVKHVKNFFFDQ
jgi:hypothetical protein